MAKVSELRDMSDEHLVLLLKETTEHFFRLRLQAQTERLDAPSELRKQRRLIARINTIHAASAARGGSSQAREETRTMPSRVAGRRRDQRQDGEDPPRRDSPPGERSAVRQVPAPPHRLHRARREQRVARGRHGRDRRVPADVADQALEAGAGGGEGAGRSTWPRRAPRSRGQRRRGAQ